MTEAVTVALIGLAGGVAGGALTLAGNYLFNFRLSRRQMQLDESSRVTAVLGSTVPNVLRATADLHTRLSNFFEDPVKASGWLRPGTAPEKDGYYLREFARRLFAFIAWGRVAQEGINSLPEALIENRPDLKKVYAFIDAAQAMLTYTWLFRGIDAYDDTKEGAHLFTGTVDEIAELGALSWRRSGGVLSRAEFATLYDADAPPLESLRTLLIHLGTDSVAGFIAARLAALRAILGGFLTNYPWIAGAPRPESVCGTLLRDLAFAGTRTDSHAAFGDVVPRNTQELLGRFGCKELIKWHRATEHSCQHSAAQQAVTADGPLRGPPLNRSVRPPK